MPLGCGTHALVDFSSGNWPVVRFNGVHISCVSDRQIASIILIRGPHMFDVFELTLMVNHACNLRCNYCYTGAKIHRPMPSLIGKIAIDRSIASLHPGGQLQLGFFGGEPLLEADCILEWVDYAQSSAAKAPKSVSYSLTTNGTLSSAAAWQVMTLEKMTLSVSHDGVPEVHDRFRRSTDGRPSSDQVIGTIDRLLSEDVAPNVSMVVRPDTVDLMADGLKFLHSRGVRQISPTLDLWTKWDHDAGLRLEKAIVESADFWSDNLPGFDISWFSEKAASIAGLSSNVVARCGFGVGQVAVSPAGNLYPCERLIENDETNITMRLPGDAFSGANFFEGGFTESAPDGRSADACEACMIRSSCATTCRCSNYIRTGDVSKPDGLLCLLDRLCYRETLRCLQLLSLDRTYVDVAALI